MVVKRIDQLEKFTGFGWLLVVALGVLLFFGGCGEKKAIEENLSKNSTLDRGATSEVKSPVHLEDWLKTGKVSGIQLLNGERKKFLPASASSLPSKNQKPVKILFTGDLMFDRYIREVAEKHGNEFIFEKVKNLFAENDLVVSNLEGPITDNSTMSVRTKIGEKNNLIFTFNPGLAKTLADNNIKIVCIGNNHILNQGKAGLEQTKKYLLKAGINYFGDTGGDSGGTIQDKEERFWIKEINGIKIGFINYNFSVRESDKKVFEDIVKIKKKVDFVIICPHWGEEYRIGDPGRSIKALAHNFIDAGADIVIGTHPHVVQSAEEYKEKKVYYSLGNFIFDQYFQKETTHGLAVQLKISPDNPRLELKEINLVLQKNGQTVPQ